MLFLDCVTCFRLFHLSRPNSLLPETLHKKKLTGIEDSIAIEFDTYQNKEFDDVNDMHIAVHTGGCRQANSAGGSTLLAHYGPLRTTNRYLQDGVTFPSFLFTFSCSMLLLSVRQEFRLYTCLRGDARRAMHRREPGIAKQCSRVPCHAYLT